MVGPASGLDAGGGSATRTWRPTGPLTRAGQHWAAVFEGGPRGFLDGAAAFEAAGLKHFYEPRIRVSRCRAAPASAAPAARHPADPAMGARRRGRRRGTSQPAGRGGGPGGALGRAATSRPHSDDHDRAAGPRRRSGDRRGDAAGPSRQTPAAPARSCCLDLLGGVRSLSELEFARECRRRGIPEPDPPGRPPYKLGATSSTSCWEQWGVVVEIDGIQHTWARTVVGDALRQNPGHSRARGRPAVCPCSASG